MADSSVASGSRRAAPAPPEAVVQLIVFRLGDEDYGIRIEQVKEVTVTPEVVKMPKTPPFIKGIANLRGDIIAIVDLEERFQLRPAGRPVPDSSYTLAVEAADLMETHRITSVLVVDDGGRLVGALNHHDLMRAKVI